MDAAMFSPAKGTAIRHISSASLPLLLPPQLATPTAVATLKKKGQGNWQKDFGRFDYMQAATISSLNSSPVPPVSGQPP